MGMGGSFDDGDPYTTNLYIGNLATTLDEQVIGSGLLLRLLSLHFCCCAATASASAAAALCLCLLASVLSPLPLPSRPSPRASAPSAASAVWCVVLM